MQLNPSTDFYDDYDDEDNEENDDDMEYERHDIENVNGKRDERAEFLPEANKLVQSINEETISKILKATDEEEDMGYDEDDERIATAVERQGDAEKIEREKIKNHNDNDNDNDNDSKNKNFMNEEGSGGSMQATLSRYKSNVNDNRFKLGYLENYHRKPVKLLTESARRDEVDSREGSGNFANDDEDSEDGNDDESEDEENEHESAGFFASTRSKSNSRYFRKNTNDAIKIISTPLGKVGIVYQQTPTRDENGKKEENSSVKKLTSLTDFDALSPDPESSHRLASSHPKITPVLTPDGKVALLYRGDSENSKYEPIRNLTHKFNNDNNKNDQTDNKASATRTKSKDTGLSSFQVDGSNEDSSDDTEGNEKEISIVDNVQVDIDSAAKINAQNENAESNIQLSGVRTVDTTGSFIIRPTDSVLPMINRPLSEVLGIKKNQFKQFRIKDIPTNPPSTEEVPRSLAGFQIGAATDSSTLHFLTKVNLAEYPTSARTRNIDFDFSRDNTMLDERTRHRDQNHQQSSESSPKSHAESQEDYAANKDKSNSIANEEVLAKTEVVNLAVIPHFDEELERLQRLREHESRRRHRQRSRQRPSGEDLSGIHCIMQAMMGIAAISTVFGMLGTFFKQRILDQIRLMHW